MPDPEEDQVMRDEDVRELRDLLSEQSRQIESLSRELAASYKKELIFFSNLEQRDRELKASETRSLKKIWWLESELRRTKEALSAAEDQHASDLRRVEDALHAAKAKLVTVTRQRDAVRQSWAGKLQRGYWSMRKRITRGGSS